MMKRYMQWMLAAILKTSGTIVLTCFVCCCATAALLTSCSSDDDNNNAGANSGTGQVTIDEPVTDQMDVSVTYPLTTASLSQFAEPSTGAALIKRLSKVTASIADDTRIVLLKGSDVSSLSDAVIDQMVHVLANDGYLAVETPTEKQLEVFYDRIDKGIAAYVANYVNDEFELTPEQMQATISASMAGRMRTRRANLAAYTHAAAADKACAELLVFGPTDYFFQEADNSDDMIITYATDTEGNIIEEPCEVAYNAGEMTAYRYGLYADGAAKWLNDTEAAKEAEEEQTERTASRRANGQKAINDLESACETFTHYQNIDYKTTANKPAYKAKACQTTLSYWSVHNMTNNRDYYYVSQKVMLSLGPTNGVDMFFARGAISDGWINAFGFGKADLLYGNYLTSYETSMTLKGDKGHINVEAATPETANQTLTETVNLTTSSTSTFGGGVVAGVNVGWTFTKGLNFNADIGGEIIHGSSKGHSFAMGNSKSIKDLSVVKNTDGVKVKWTYTGKDLQVKGKKGKWEHDIVPDILVNDANIANDACWSVENPSGNYTVSVQSQPEVGMLLINNNSSNPATVAHTKTSLDTYSHQLKKPNRCMQTWRMFIVINEWMPGQNYYPDVQQKLEDDFKNNFSDIYTDVFNVCESEENSVLLATAIIKNAKRVLDANKDQLPGIAEGRGVKQFAIYWRCDDTNVKLRNAYVVKVE